MLKSGQEYLESIRDGRTVYIGRERIEDVTAHPAFASAAKMYAGMYDMKRQPANKDVTWFEDGGEKYSLYYLQPKSRDDLVKRTACHTAIANFSHGLLGRSPDHVASSITGMSLKPEVFDDGKAGRNYHFSDNVVSYYNRMKREDLFTCYAILSPQGARSPELYESKDRKPPTLRVTAEDDSGVTLNGMKMLATGAVYANEAIIGNILPLAPSQIKESITCTVPMATQGLSLWSRKPFALDARNRFDNPLSYAYDETDSMLVFENVKVPWERVFVHDNVEQARSIYIRTPAHIFSNHQSNVRFWAKLRLLVGLASKITRSNGARDIPAVRETLGKLAAMEACYGGMIAGQHQGMETMDNGYVHVNRRYMYAAANYALENHAAICDQIRTLCGGGVFQMPAFSDVTQDDGLNRVFQEYWSTLDQTATERMKLFRVAWDLLGSEFAGRHDQYEKFYIGPSFVVRNYNFVNAPWDTLESLVDG
ncbi:MAG: 4-hydroxyphenylacetate 3-hydroxylase family protein, partial [Alphaproteobacteria bacterium]